MYQSPEEKKTLKVTTRQDGIEISKDIYSLSPLFLNRKQSQQSHDSEHGFEMEHQKIYGTTIHIGQIEIDTIFGKFQVHTYQNLITKGYILAIAHGDIKSQTLYTRIHSSCVTSENMRSLDCDCVLQLEGAMKKIAEKKNGILFYLIQEGRGCGYVGKSRACMIVQYTHEQMNTFEAYNLLGMKKDYREYDSIRDILKMLRINPEFVLLTNNPDKIQGLKNLGINVVSVSDIEFTPNPFNQEYLKAKAESGHLLFMTKNKNQKYKFTFDPLKPFEPYNLEEATRFMHVSSYYLPIKPVKKRFLVYEDDCKMLKEKHGQQIKFTEIYNGKFLVEFDESIEALDAIITQPYWINVNVYYDIQTNQDYIVLVYKDIGWETRVPIVRIQSESIIDRFPLKDTTQKSYYKVALKEIVENGYGVIAIFYNDGIGHGFGNYVIGKTTSELEQQQTGILNDVRDYLAVSILVKHQVAKDNVKEIDLLYSCKTYEEKSKKFFEQQDLIVRKMHYIGKPELRDIEGFQEMSQKIDKVHTHLVFDHLKVPDIKLEGPIYITGIGSSESHAKYLNYLLQKHTDLQCKFISVMEFYDFKPRGTLIVFSQGLSKNSYHCIRQYNYQNIILFTAVTEKNEEKYQNDPKQVILRKLKEGNSTVINFPVEDEYETLIRLVGPLCGYQIAYQFACSQSQTLKPLDNDKKILQQIQILRTRFMDGATEKWIQNLLKYRQIVIISGPGLIDYLQNIQYKFIEGMFINACQVKSYLELVHGQYQSMEYNRVHLQQTTNILVLRTGDDKLFYDKLLQMLDNNYPIWTLNSKLSEEMKILEYEICLNYCLLQVLERSEINQKNWYGMDRQHYLYNLEQ